MYSRRDLAKIALGALPALRLLAKPNSFIRGVTLGVRSYSFRDRSLDDALKAMTAIGFSTCELWEGHVVPSSLTRNGLREWRENIAIEQFQIIRENFNKAGVKIDAFNYSFRPDFSDKEIDRGFEMAKALGARVITAASTVDVAPRINAFALKHDMMVGMQNGDRIEPNEFATAADFDAAMKGNAKIAVSLDIGDFAACGFDPVSYVEQHYGRIVALHIKDRKKDHGPVVPLGQGDTPVAGVLKTLALYRFPIPAMVAYDYKSEDTNEAVRQSYEYCRQVLLAKPAKPQPKQEAAEPEQ